MKRRDRRVFLASGTLIDEIESLRGWIETVHKRNPELDPGVFSLLKMSADIMDELERRQAILFDKFEALEVAALKAEALREEEDED